MSAFAEHPRRFQARGAAPDDHCLLAVGRGRDGVREVQLPARGGIVHALGVTGIVDRVEAVTRPYAGADAILRPCGHLGDQVGVRYLGPGHADQVEQALPYGVSCRGDVGDASGVHHGDIEPALDLGGEVQERRRGRPHGRDRLRQGSVALDGAPDGADEVDAVVDVQAGRRQRLLEGESAGSVLLQRHADADDEVRPDRGADRANHAAGDSSSVRQASPRSSRRWFVAGDRKLSRKCPYAWISTPSSPPSSQRAAASA